MNEKNASEVAAPVSLMAVARSTTDGDYLVVDQHRAHGVRCLTSPTGQNFIVVLSSDGFHVGAEVKGTSHLLVVDLLLAEIRHMRVSSTVDSKYALRNP